MSMCVFATQFLQTKIALITKRKEEGLVLEVLSIVVQVGQETYRCRVWSARKIINVKHIWNSRVCVAEYLRKGVIICIKVLVKVAGLEVPLKSQFVLGVSIVHGIAGVIDGMITAFDELPQALEKTRVGIPTT